MIYPCIHMRCTFGWYIILQTRLPLYLQVCISMSTCVIGWFTQRCLVCLARGRGGSSNPPSQRAKRFRRGQWCSSCDGGAAGQSWKEPSDLLFLLPRPRTRAFWIQNISPTFSNPCWWVIQLGLNRIRGWHCHVSSALMRAEDCTISIDLDATLKDPRLHYGRSLCPCSHVRGEQMVACLPMSSSVHYCFENFTRDVSTCHDFK